MGMLKSDLDKCLDPIEKSKEKDFDCKILDVLALIHMLKPNAVKSFKEYVKDVLKRIDIVWNRYLANSIKGSTREKRGVGVR